MATHGMKPVSRRGALYLIPTPPERPSKKPAERGPIEMGPGFTHGQVPAGSGDLSRSPAVRLNGGIPVGGDYGKKMPALAAAVLMAFLGLSSFFASGCGGEKGPDSTDAGASDAVSTGRDRMVGDSSKVDAFYFPDARGDDGSTPPRPDGAPRDGGVDAGVPSRPDASGNNPDGVVTD